MSNDQTITKLPTQVDCPTCQKSIPWSEESTFRPFCSKRCQQIDFGEWATESFSIPVTDNSPEYLEQGGEGIEHSGLQEFDDFEEDPIKH